MFGVWCPVGHNEDAECDVATSCGEKCVYIDMLRRYAVVPLLCVCHCMYVYVWVGGWVGACVRA